MARPPASQTADAGSASGGPQPLDAFTRSVRRRLAIRSPERTGSDDPAGAGIAEAFRFLDERGASAHRIRIDPPGWPLLDGRPARGSVVELACGDRPFLLTSIDEEMRARGNRPLRVLAVAVGCRRDEEGRIREVGPARGADHVESILQLEVGAALDGTDADATEAAVERVLANLYQATSDRDAMRDLLGRAGDRTRATAALRFAPEDVAEALELLDWMLEGHAVLLGTARYPVSDGAVGPAGPETCLGVLRPTGALSGATVDLPPPLTPPDTLLRIDRLSLISSVHRQVPMLRFDLALVGEDGTVQAIGRLLWIFARRAEAAPVSSIPLLRRKLERVLEREDVVPGSYDEQHLTALFQALPRDDLLCLGVDDVGAMVAALLVEDADQQVRVVTRAVPESHAVAVLVTLPHERWTRAVRERLSDFLCVQLDGTRVDVDLSMGGASDILARFLVHVDPDEALPADLGAIGRELRLLCHSWDEQLTAGLRARDVTDARALVDRWADALPESYRDAVPAVDAVDDVIGLEALEPVATITSADARVGVRLGGPRRAGAPLRLVLTSDRAIELSRLLPVLESLDLWVVDEAHWAVAGGTAHLHHVGVRPRGGEFDRTRLGEGLTDAVVAALSGEAETDGLNRLVVRSGLDWRAVAILRAYRRYRHQVDTRYDESYVDDVLVANPEVARALVELFEARADPTGPHPEAAAAAAARVAEACDRVARLDHDRILRGLAGTIEATLRTNRVLRPTGPLALKLDPARVPGMPAPVPYREVFVYGAEVEGVHLRAGPVARGGLRASDRIEDYRAEVLDLMRAQVLKNAVIVPTGAKGGFIVRGPEQDDRRGQVRAAYQAFVSALLDVTDDLDGDEVVARKGRWDGDDPYLVVAADKGTAAFSDVANAIAEERDFWLGDAFASGGSRGYDHKALGITARGAWVAIDRHLRALGIDPDRDEITVAGVGDMSGDVFGNGLLRSDRLRLVAAFDHRDIFLDPDPDPAASFAERRRLFGLGASSWSDYDGEVMSLGGGVHSRGAKAVTLSAEARRALRVEAAELTPADLVRAVLCAPVDLLYFGGIGTYVRARSEDDGRIDDRANAEVRVVARDLRARVVGEGANLALTQSARIEYARRGGRINIDAIDNAAGVDSSDHEVNLKILLARAESDGEIGRAERDRLLAHHADDVVAAVLTDCAEQSDALDRAERASATDLGAWAALLDGLVSEGVLDPVVEALPGRPELELRQRAGAGLTRPELAVTLAGVKRRITEELMASEVPDEPAIRPALAAYFPTELAERYDHLLDRHRLRRELVASKVANDLVDRLGPEPILDLAGELGATVAEIATAYWVARGIVGAPELWALVAARTHGADPGSAVDATDAGTVLVDLLRHLTRSELIRWRRSVRRNAPWEPGARIAEDRPVADALRSVFAEEPDERRRRQRAERALRLVAGGLDSEVAARFAAVGDLDLVSDIADVSRDVGRDTVEVLTAFRAVSDSLGVDALMASVAAIEVDGGWGRTAKRGLVDDLVGIRREAARRSLLVVRAGETPGQAVERHLARSPAAAAESSAVRRRLDADPAAGLDAMAVAVRAARRAAL